MLGGDTNAWRVSEDPALCNAVVVNQKRGDMGSELGIMVVRPMVAGDRVVLYGLFAAHQPFIFSSFRDIEINGLRPQSMVATRGSGVTETFMNMVQSAVVAAHGDGVAASRAFYSQFNV